MLKTVTATEYIAPLREGGSLPAILKADDGEIYATKFVGAGQGAKALIAELLAGEIARVLGLRVPEIALIQLDPAIGHTEPDAEIQDLLHASAGLNLGLKFLSHASSFNLLSPPRPDGDFASRVVWFDAFVTNVDRTPRNVNMLVQGGQVWLIDHGAALYFHHSWQHYLRQSESPFSLIKDHVLLPLADRLAEADRACREKLSRAVFEAIIAAIPDPWLNSQAPFPDRETHRRAYGDFLEKRLQSSHIFVGEAERARAQIL